MYCWLVWMEKATNCFVDIGCVLILSQICLWSSPLAWAHWKIMRYGFILFQSRMFVLPLFPLLSTILVFVFPTYPSHGHELFIWGLEMWLLKIRSFHGMYTEGRLRSVGVVWRNTNEKECGFPDCNDKRVWGRKGFCGDVEFVFQMLISADEVLLDAVTMICIPSAGMWRKLEKSLMVFLVRSRPPWNAIITGYVQCGLSEEEIDLYCLMKAVRETEWDHTGECVICLCWLRDTVTWERISSVPESKRLRAILMDGLIDSADRRRQNGEPPDNWERGPIVYCTTGISHHIFHRFLPYSRSSKKERKKRKIDDDWMHKLATWASQFLVAACVHSTEARRRVFTEISNVLNDFVDSSNGFMPPVALSYPHCLMSLISSSSTVF